MWVEGGRGEGVNLMEEKRKWGTPPGEKGTTSVKSPGTQTFKSTGSSKGGALNLIKLGLREEEEL